MTVDKLNAEQIDELRWSLVCGETVDYGWLEKSDEEVKAQFAGIDFTEGDFACTEEE